MGGAGVQRCQRLVGHGRAMKGTYSELGLGAPGWDVVPCGAVMLLGGQACSVASDLWLADVGAGAQAWGPTVSGEWVPFGVGKCGEEAWGSVANDWWLADWARTSHQGDLQ